MKINLYIKIKSSYWGNIDSFPNTFIGFLFYIFFITNNSQAQTPLFTQHPLSIDSIGELKASKILQSRQGWIWFATAKGVIRYNGIESILYKTESEVTALFEDINNQLWVGLKDGRIFQLKKNQLQLWALEEGLPKVPITGFAEDKHKNIWFSTYGEGLYVYNKKHLINFGTDDGLLGNDIYSLLSDNSDKIWIGTDAGVNICHYENEQKSIEKRTDTEGVPDLIIRTLAKDKQGNIWLGMYDKGFCRYNIQTNKIDFVIPNWQYGVVEALHISPDAIWVGTENNGLLHYNLITQNLRQIGLNKEKIEDIDTDNEGNAWVLSQKSGIFTTNRRFEHIPLNLQNIQTILSTQNGKLYIGTKEGLFIKKDNAEGYEKVLPNALNILCLYQDFMQNIWIGTFGQGLFCLKANSNQLIKFTENEGLSNGSIFSIDGKEDNLWLATLGGVSALDLMAFSRGQKNIFTVFNKNKGLSTDFIYKILADSKNRIWFGTDGKGISCLENGIIKNYTEANGQPLDAVYSITEDVQGHIWFTTSNNKLYKFDGMNFKEMLMPSVKNNRKIMALTTDANGDIMLACTGSIDVLNPFTKQVVSFEKEWQNRPFDPSLNAFSKTQTGSIFFASQTDIIQYNTLKDSLTQKPRLTLRGVSIFMQPIDFQSNSQFSYNQNYMTFDYDGFWFSQPDKVRYRYRLAGLDPDWQYTKERQITYPNLPKGTFTLYIQAALNDNFDQYAEISYRFTIKPALWQEWWFYVLLSVIFGALVYYFVQKREKRLENEATLKREKVEAQLEMLKSQINPHFLFNSFNTLIATIEDNPTDAVEYTEKLSDFFRNILQVREKSVISIQEELILLENFMFLLKKRHGDTIRFDINLTSKNDFIVPLTLQLLVENAVKHNIVSKNRPLSISINETAEGMIEIKNNLQRKAEKDNQSTHFGLSSIKSRYEHLTNKPVILTENKDFFIVLIPVLKKEL